MTKIYLIKSYVYGISGCYTNRKLANIKCQYENVRIKNLIKRELTQDEEFYVDEWPLSHHNYEKELEEELFKSLPF